MTAKQKYHLLQAVCMLKRKTNDSLIQYEIDSEGQNKTDYSYIRFFIHQKWQFFKLSSKDLRTIGNIYQIVSQGNYP